MCASIRFRSPFRTQSNCARRSAFSLVELLVVIALIVMLIATLIPSLRKSMRMAASTVCMYNLRDIGNSLAMYRYENNGWLPTSKTGNSSTASSTSSNGNVWFLKLYPTYMPEPMVLACPEDPFRYRFAATKDDLHASPTAADFASYGINSFIMSAGGGFMANLDRHQPARPLDNILVADLGPDQENVLQGPGNIPTSGRARNGSQLAVDDGYDPYDGSSTFPWLTVRHGKGINVLTIGGGVREARTDDAATRPVSYNYPMCHAGGCTLCNRLYIYHYSFARDRLFWWTGPLPRE